MTLHADRDLGPLRETSAARTASLHVGVKRRLPTIYVFHTINSVNIAHQECVSYYSYYSTSRCTTSPGSDWRSDTYDDTDWQEAHQIHQNTASVPSWGQRDGISTRAFWIWTVEWQGNDIDTSVYCRHRVSHGE